MNLEQIRESVDENANKVFQVHALARVIAEIANNKDGDDWVDVCTLTGLCEDMLKNIAESLQSIEFKLGQICLAQTRETEGESG
jgi:hypothetical protein